jgi:RNA polymerase sigma factor (sigma-70 family)
MVHGQLNPVQRLLRRLAAPAPAAPTDGQLLQRFAAGREQEAFAELVRRHGPMVLAVCRRVLGDADDADDAFQATFLVLARRAGAVRKRDSVGSWLYGVACRVARKARVGAARRRARERQVADMPRAEPTAEAVWREVRPVLDEELSRLPEKYRAPVVLCYLEGRTHAEAARQLGWPTGTVSGRLARARDLLRGRLARRGLGLSGGLVAALLGDQAAPAAVPATLARTTIDAAATFAAGNAAAGTASAPAAALAKGVLHTMYLTKLKIVTAVVLAAGLVGTGAGIFGPYAPGGWPAQASVLDDQPGQRDETLKEENERLKKELAQAKEEIQRLKKQIKNVQEALEGRLAATEQDQKDAVRQRAKAAQEAAQEAGQRAEERARAQVEDAEARRQRAIAVVQTDNNLKQIGLAMHNYHDVHGRFPAGAIYGKGGKPLLSWRVALLPYLEQENLYKQFRLDEPWDSEHNKGLLSVVPKVYIPVTGKDRERPVTYYRGFTGNGTIFEGTQGRRLADITDGTSNTLLVVEAGEAVPWTKPDELPYDPDKPLPKLGGLFDGDFHILMADGSTRYAQKKYNEQVLRALITYNGGEVVDLKDLNK